MEKQLSVSLRKHKSNCKCAKVRREYLPHVITLLRLQDTVDETVHLPVLSGGSPDWSYCICPRERLVAKLEVGQCAHLVLFSL